LGFLGPFFRILPLRLFYTFGWKDPSGISFFFADLTTFFSLQAVPPPISNSLQTCQLLLSCLLGPPPFPDVWDTARRIDGIEFLSPSFPRPWAPILRGVPVMVFSETGFLVPMRFFYFPPPPLSPFEQNYIQYVFLTPFFFFLKLPTPMLLLCVYRPPPLSRFLLDSSRIPKVLNFFPESVPPCGFGFWHKFRFLLSLKLPLINPFQFPSSLLIPCWTFLNNPIVCPRGLISPPFFSGFLSPLVL